MLLVKYAFVVVPGWKAYVEISFHMRKGQGINKKTGNTQ